jgi:hypothetical protein
MIEPEIFATKMCVVGAFRRMRLISAASRAVAPGVVAGTLRSFVPICSRTTSGL